MVLTIGPTTFKLLSVIAYEIVDPMFICFIGLCLSPLVLRAGSVSVFLSRYRFSVFWSVFSKVGIGFGIGFSKYRDIGFGLRFFRTNLPLLIE